MHGSRVYWLSFIHGVPRYSPLFLLLLWNADIWSSQDPNTFVLKLLDRFKRTGSVIHLDGAIKIMQTLVNTTEHDHPHLPALLSTLGSAFNMRFERTGCPEDLKQAISTNELAVGLTP